MGFGVFPKKKGISSIDVLLLNNSLYLSDGLRLAPPHRARATIVFIYIHCSATIFFSRFLPDAEYGVALDNLVKGCTDILLVNPDGTRIFIGKRCVQRECISSTLQDYSVISREP